MRLNMVQGSIDILDCYNKERSLHELNGSWGYLKC
jgi:hypothetical protein